MPRYIDPDALAPDAAKDLALSTTSKVAEAKGQARSISLTCPDLAASVDTVERALRAHHRRDGYGRWDDQPSYEHARAARTALAEARMLAELLAATLDRAQGAALALSAKPAA